MKAELREKLAEREHNQWVDWMRYLFAKGTFNEDGTWTMPKWAVDRWVKQAETPYVRLSKSEKNCDRHEADKVLAIVNSDNLTLSDKLLPYDPKSVKKETIELG